MQLKTGLHAKNPIYTAGGHPRAIRVGRRVIFAEAEMENRRKSLEIILPEVPGTAMELPLAESRVSAGFPSPADDYMEMSLDLNRELVRNPASTFYARVRGVSMEGEGIRDGDLLVIDRAAEIRDGVLAVCCIDGEFTLKRVRRDPKEACIWLVPANPDYEPLRVTEENDFRIWGIVRYVIKEF